MTKTFKLCSDGNVIQELAILNKESLKKYLKSGTKIKFKIPPYLELEGEIVGLSYTPTPLIGAHYIVKANDTSKIKRETYPYEYFCAYRCMFDIIGETTSQIANEKLDF